MVAAACLIVWVVGLRGEEEGVGGEEEKERRKSILDWARVRGGDSGGGGEGLGNEGDERRA